MFSTLLTRQLLKGLLTVAIVATVAAAFDIGFLYYQATRGIRLPFKLNVIPRMGE